MTNRNCLYCYEKLDKSETDYHERCCLAFFGSRQAPLLSYSLKEMAELARNVVERSIAVPGVQPKLSLSLVSEALATRHRVRFTVVGALGGNYILKPPSDQFPEMPQNEHLTMKMAEAFGIRTVKSNLIRLKSGELAYLTKRIDRTEAGGKLHMLDMLQIIEASDKYKSSMEKVGKALNDNSANTLLDKLYLFELIIFCFLTGNNDMHLKNFSMILENGSWTLSPAYDLLNVQIVNPKDTEELALTLEGKKTKLRREHFERFGKGLDLTAKQMEGVFSRMIKNRALAFDLIDHSFLSSRYRKAYTVLLEKRYATLIK